MKQNRFKSLILFILLGKALFVCPVFASGGLNIIPGAGLADKVRFEKQWVDYDITENGSKGMKIHLRFQAIGLKDSLETIAIYFEYDDERGRLKDRNKKFYSTSGEVAAYKDIQPVYDPALFEDLQIFMPYDELDLFPGSYFLKMDIDLIRPKGGLVQHLNYYKFDYTKPQENSSSPASEPTATLTRMWVDYDVMSNGQKGMMIHVNFSMLNLKNIESYLVIVFEMKNGDKIYTNNKDYRNKAGQLTLYQDLKPAFDNTVYSDMKSFLPYNELSLGKGSFDLRYIAMVMGKEGTIIKELGKQEFHFSQ